MSDLIDRALVISEDNFIRLSELYGEINAVDLYRIVNNHILVAVEEIEEDTFKSGRSILSGNS